MSDKKKESFEWKELYQNKKYRARVLLLFYLILFIVLISSVGGSKPFENYSNKEDLFEQGEEEKEKEENRLIKEFDLIRSKNFEFEFEFLYNTESYRLVGKRNDQKQMFTLSSSNNSIDFLVDGEKVLAREEENGSYETANLPYQYLNYFDVSLLEEILSQSGQIDDTTYEISNTLLSSILKENKEVDGITSIRVERQNNYITGLAIDYSEYAKSKNEDIEWLEVILKYKNFNLVDDFERKFE